MQKAAIRICVIVSLFLLIDDSSSAQSDGPYVVVGIGFKFGYAFAGQSSFLGGLELSVNYYRDLTGIGILVSTEQWTSGRRLYHYAFQGFWRITGFSFGPTIVTSKDSKVYGCAMTFFAGAILLPYYRLSLLPNESDAHELGFYAKLPLPLVIPKFSLSG